MTTTTTEEAIDLCPLVEAGTYFTNGYYSKGHHDPVDFLRFVYMHCGDRHEVSKVEHHYWRSGWQTVDGERMPGLFNAKKGDRGAYPVTVIWTGDRLV